MKSLLPVERPAVFGLSGQDGHSCKSRLDTLILIFDERNNTGPFDADKAQDAMIPRLIGFKNFTLDFDSFEQSCKLTVYQFVPDPLRNSLASLGFNNARALRAGTLPLYFRLLEPNRGWLVPVMYPTTYT